jgi:predicted ThiF/HesA family dinucleotide-utilizing enzyme
MKWSTSWTAWTLLLGSLLGCSSSGSQGPCKARSGTYAITFTQQSGNCGAIAESVATLPLPASSSATACTGTVTASSDECTTMTNGLTCPTNDAAMTSVRENGTVHWSTDGASGSGTLEVEVLDSSGQIQCAGAYGVNYSRK